MIKIYICEDEKPQLEQLCILTQEYIEKTHREAELVAGESNPGKLLEEVRCAEGDSLLFLLDVQLKGSDMDGFDLAREIRKSWPHSHLVFLTSREELAYEVFERGLNVLDYIVKQPAFFLRQKMDEQLKMRMDRIFEKIEKKEDERKTSKILVECGSRMIEITMENILYVQAIKTERQIEVCCENQKLLLRQSLRILYEKLGEGFLYANKSCIVQKSKIREIDRKNRYLILQNGERIEVSFREMRNIIEMFRE